MGYTQVKVNDMLIPRFCPSCGTSSAAGARLCGDCGDALVDQGYCPVCERFLPARVAATCPKHGVPLEAEPAPLADDLSEAARGGRWTTVTRASSAAMLSSNCAEPSLLPSFTSTSSQLRPSASSALRTREYKIGMFSASLYSGIVTVTSITVPAEFRLGAALIIVSAIRRISQGSIVSILTQASRHPVP